MTELSLLSSTLRKLELVASLDTLIAEATDWRLFNLARSSGLSCMIHLADLYTGGQDVNRVHYLFAALADASRFLLGARHAAPPSGVIEAFESECLSAAREFRRLHRLCRDVETDPTTADSPHLQLDDRNPLRVGTARPGAPVDLSANSSARLRTYAEMKASLKPVGRSTDVLALSLTCLASSSGGLDVLEIMRNINVFVAKYLYNLNNQIFVEKAFKQQALEHHQYSSHEGLTFLDHFRLLITQNRQRHGLPADSTAAAALSDLCRTSKISRRFEELASKLEFESQGTVTAAQQLDQTVRRSIVKNYSEGTDFSLMLVDVFAKEFRDKRMPILRNVHVIVASPDCETFGLFSDDGFAMGLAYVLKLLDQSRESSIPCIGSAQFRGTNGTLKAEASSSWTRAGRSDEKLQQTLTLTLSRHERYSREFALLDQGLTSARIFFPRRERGRRRRRQRRKWRRRRLCSRGPDISGDSGSDAGCSFVNI
uniref:Uncharacterized protein n=1 Tax=Macrostomum lignano TaxID=282301 RepID=A0A1I8F6J0_9PLAT